MESISPQSHSIQTMQWTDLQVTNEELRIDSTLNMGQCFNWRLLKSADEQLWVGLIGSDPFALKQMGSTTMFCHLLQHSSHAPPLQYQTRVLRDYFQLSHSMVALNKLWASKCDRMRTILDCIRGVRIVRQDPWECLISFICSSNNNIARISQMIYKLRYNYGRYVCSLQFDQQQQQWEVILSPPSKLTIEEQKLLSPVGQRTKAARTPTSRASEAMDDSEDDVELQADSNPVVVADTLIHLYDFPSAAALACVDETDLRALGMGYRAKFIVGSARKVCEKTTASVDWLHTLRSMGDIDALSSCAANTVHDDAKRLEVQTLLQELPGVGRKVADCVALFSLDQTGAVPVDTHVWRIATRDYAPQLQTAKSLTPAVYEQVGEVLRRRFERKAGWAHSVLFAGELPQFRALLPSSMQSEMKLFVDSQRLEKKEQRDAKTQRKQEQQQQQQQRSPSESKLSSNAKVKLENVKSISVISETPSAAALKRKLKVELEDEIMRGKPKTATPISKPAAKRATAKKRSK